MTMLSTEFCGLKLKNPIIVASCPASETKEGIIKCYKAGAGAVILKSMADYDESKYQLGPRRTKIDQRGFWATSSFRRETLSRKAGIKLIKECRKEVPIPIIASITGLSYDPLEWLPICMEAQDSGADMLQLDLFYLPQPIVEEDNFRRLKELIKAITTEVSIPVIPKLSIEIPVYLATTAFTDTKIAGFSLIDSVRVNSPIDITQQGKTSYGFIEMPGMSSVLGKWQFPLTQHYTFIIGKHTNLPICGGGGMETAEDAIELMMLGATVVQYATAILKNGYEHIGKLLTDMENLVQKLGYQSIAELQGVAKRDMTTDIQKSNTIFLKSSARIDYQKCQNCFRCINTAFCEALSKPSKHVEIDKQSCEGCGLCASLCKHDAIQLA